MASDYTEGLGVELIGSGDKAGSWGDVTNNNLQALEEGISRYAEIAVTGATADLDIPDASTAYSVDSKGRSSVIKWTGDPSNATHTVTLKVGNINRTQARFTAVNSLTSPAVLVISCGVGTNVSIPNGYSANVHIEIDAAGTALGVVNSLSSLSIDKLALGNQEVISNTVDDRVDIISPTLQVGAGDDGSDTIIQAAGGGANAGRDLVIRNNALGSAGSIRFNDVGSGPIEITPGGTGSVVMPKVTISDGTIAGTVITDSSIGSSSPSTGAFTSLGASSTSNLSTVVTSGNILADGGSTIRATGGLLATAGGLTVTAGGITVSSGATNLTGGGIQNAGSIGATSLTATTGDLTTNSGDIQATAGNLGVGVAAPAAGTGNISADGLITTSGNIETTGSGTISSDGRVTSGNGLTAGGTITDATDITASGTATADGFVAETSGLIINAGGLTVNGSTDLNGDGIVEVGPISSVTTVNSGGAAVSFGGNISTAGSGTTPGTITSAGRITSNGGLDTGGTITGATDITASGTVSTADLTVSNPISGDITGSSGSTTGNAETVTRGVYTDNNLSVMAPTTANQLRTLINGDTGSGNLVFADGPTLTAPNLGTITSGDGSALTGTASSLTAGNATNAVTAATVTTIPLLSGDVTNNGNAITIPLGSITEAQLAITGAPTTNYVLTATNGSGGMEWIAPSTPGGGVTSITGGSGIGITGTASVPIVAADSTIVRASDPVKQLSGDVSTDGTTSVTTLASNAVTEAKIATNAVTAPKLSTTGPITNGNVLSVTGNGAALEWISPGSSSGVAAITSGTINGATIGASNASTVRGTSYSVPQADYDIFNGGFVWEDGFGRAGFTKELLSTPVKLRQTGSGQRGFINSSEMVSAANGTTGYFTDTVTFPALGDQPAGGIGQSQQYHHFQIAHGFSRAPQVVNWYFEKVTQTNVSPGGAFLGNNLPSPPVQSSYSNGDRVPLADVVEIGPSTPLPNGETGSYSTWKNQVHIGIALQMGIWDVNAWYNFLYIHRKNNLINTSANSNTLFYEVWEPINEGYWRDWQLVVEAWE